MSFIDTVVSFVMELLGKVKGYIEAFLNFLEALENSFPGLVAIIEPLVDKGQEIIDAVISNGGSEDMVEAAKTEAREGAVAEAKESLSASPRYVPEYVIRATVEAIAYGKKYMRENGTKYDEAEVMKHAQDMLSKYGAGQGR